jgi:epoxyqueuosine reductase
VGDLKASLVAAARDLEFDLCGVAAAGPAAGADRLRRWLDAGMHGDMEWMESSAEARSDPCRLLPGCRSVIVVAASYRTSHEPSTARRDGTVWISRYAWGRDYHRVLKKRLVRLGRWLESTTGESAWRACVDTAPILEREWAARAGLGWIGKSTMLLNRRLGSELFLGVLLSAARIEPDSPAPDHCGGCTACLDACPTGAFVAPRVLDARRCVAYLTIEHRREIPREFRSGIEDMVAGCDRCNEVCPFTRKAPADLHDEFQPAPHRKRPRLESLEALDEEGWKAWRRGSAVGRIPFDALRRTLGVVRHNLGCEASASGDGER